MASLDTNGKSSLKVAAQVDRMVKLACSLLAFIGRGIGYKSQNVIMQLCRTLGRLHLECCVQFLRAPHYRKDMQALPRVQRGFTRKMPGLVLELQRKKQALWPTKTMPTSDLRYTSNRYTLGTI